ncbi:MAG: 1-acyl-sn-glycerol-3-phosphate acyltransferase [Oscillospiraceae bacterium]|nr:1-acyl-sn-glycerol-3-phosphate acyltransferase [Oscillospiraceae bacterium]
MKIRTRSVPYEKLLALPKQKHQKPLRPNPVLTTVVRVASILDTIPTGFRYRKHRMEAAGKGPWLILMNHSSFIDLKLASAIFYPKPYCIVSTTDAMVGKKLLMRMLGCIPTQKFVTDLTLIGDIQYALKELKTSVLMYPEAGYSFDGTATALPRKLGVLLKKLDVPVVMVETHGAFLRDPLYNGLQNRKIRVSADVTCLLTQEEIHEKSVAELDAVLEKAFTFDGFRWQKENGIEIKEKFRADGLNRVLYKCAACGAEGTMEGRGTKLTCSACGKVWELKTDGSLQAEEGETHIDHIPDWYRWEREEVRRELENGTYAMALEVEIAVMADDKALYQVGSGHLRHDENGFLLTGCEGKLHYEQSPVASHTLNSDFFWYQIGDVIGIGDRERLYYCFPKEKDVVTKARLAAEELYKMKKQRRPVRV